MKKNPINSWRGENNISSNSQEDRRTAKRKLGDIGEDVACVFLKKRGYEIVERNYLRKWGEIDIISRKGGKLHFIEVKSVTHATSGYRPEDNMHPWKLKRLYRTIETYLLHQKHSEGPTGDGVDWQLDLITVRINTDTREARVELIENIVG